MNDNYNDSIYEKKVPKIKSCDIKIINKKNEYDISNNFLNPNKSSPPNEFMNKLLQRIKCYDYEYEYRVVNSKTNSIVK
jgi:hypothetical protein